MSRPRSGTGPYRQWTDDHDTRTGRFLRAAGIRQVYASAIFGAVSLTRSARGTFLSVQLGASSVELRRSSAFLAQELTSRSTARCCAAPIRMTSPAGSVSAWALRAPTLRRARCVQQDACDALALSLRARWTALASGRAACRRRDGCYGSDYSIRSQTFSATTSNPVDAALNGADRPVNRVPLISTESTRSVPFQDWIWEFSIFMMSLLPSVRYVP